MRYQQLQLFTRPATAAMRDRTKARNYSPEKDEFRRDHARRRQWGLARRHAQKLCRSRGCSRECAEVGLHDHAEAVPPLIWPAEATCARRPSRPTAAPARNVLAGGDRPSGTQRPHRATIAARPESARQAEPSTRAETANRAKPTTQTETTSQAKPTTRAETTGPAEVDGRLDWPGESVGQLETGCRHRSASPHERRRPTPVAASHSTGWRYRPLAPPRKPRKQPIHATGAGADHHPVSRTSPEHKTMPNKGPTAFHCRINRRRLPQCRAPPARRKEGEQGEFPAQHHA